MSDDSSTNNFIPQVAEDKKPVIGLEFESIEHGFNFYNAYARESGFSARMNNSRKKKGTDEIIWKQFVCYKEGVTNKQHQNRGERNRGDVRVGCKAKLTLVKQQSGHKWVVCKFVEGHNHALATPTKVHMLRSHRNVSTAKKVLSQQFSEANIPTCQKMRVLEIEHGSPSNIGCMEKDIRNYEQKLRDEHKNIDAETLIEFFQSEKEKDSNFYFDFQLDDSNRLNRCFWTDSFSRTSYHYFGDVVVFDTTYNTNRYDMIFAPLTGVNHHGQTIIFGAALLSDERIESFIWLFNQMLSVMPRGAPQVIITDQDPAMSRAILEVLPATCHRYCRWHIMNKFSEKLGAVVYRDTYHMFKNVILNSETVEDFENNWAELLNTTNLGNHVWLGQLYEIRSRWVPAFVNQFFSAGMSSSQRAEGSHAFFKKYICNKNSLMDFITRFNRALTKQRYAELHADWVDINEQPRMKSLWPMEGQMANVYTKRNLLIFQDEIFQSSAYILNVTCEDEQSGIYIVQRMDSGASSKRRHLLYNKVTDFVTCSCMKFENIGIPCAHMLTFFRIKCYTHLPSQYILTRWTKGAKVGGGWDIQNNETNDQTNQSLLCRHARLSHLSSIFVDRASLTNEGTNFAENELQMAINKVDAMNIGSSAEVGCSVGRRSSQTPQSISNPAHVRSKGCGKRLKSSKEISVSKSRLCKGCGLRGQSHDKRNCPKLQERSTADDMEPNLSSSSDDGLDSHTGSYNFSFF